MGEVLSQEKIDAMLKEASKNVKKTEELNEQEIDLLGEVGNIGMGSAATTLYTLLGQRVSITTPKVTITNWEKIVSQCQKPIVVVKVEYTQGLSGSNILVMNEDDVKIITSLMMGGNGEISNEELSELHLSAISEAMNQMVGSASTSIAQIIQERIDISTPKVENITLSRNENDIIEDTYKTTTLVEISFRMEIGKLIDSTIMQIMPFEFAKSLFEKLYTTEKSKIDNDANNLSKNDKVDSISNNKENKSLNTNIVKESRERKVKHEESSYAKVHPVEFEDLKFEKITTEKESIGLIMDVPLEVTVELGRTNKLIKDILEFGPGSIIELDKLAGESVDIMINSKNIAKGEVIVIDENFGVRITDIIHPSKRI